MTAAAEAWSASGTVSAKAAAFETKSGSPGTINSLRHRLGSRFQCFNVSRFQRNKDKHSHDLRGGSIVLRLQYALFESDRNVPPYLNRENDRGGQKQRTYGDVGHRGNNHGQLGLSRIASPGNAREEGGESQAQLGEEKRQHQNRGTPDRFNFRIDAKRAHCG